MLFTSALLRRIGWHSYACGLARKSAVVMSAMENVASWFLISIEFMARLVTSMWDISSELDFLNVPEIEVICMLVLIEDVPDSAS